jgi:hypothetical protein
MIISTDSNANAAQNFFTLAEIVLNIAYKYKQTMCETAIA